jgi:hypothetical protein
VAKAPINVTITGDYNDRDIQRAINDLNSLKRGGADTGAAMGGFSKVSGLAFAAVSAAAVAAGAVLTKFFTDSIGAAMEDEKSMRSLQIAMENMGLAAQNAPVEEFVDKLARVTGVADNQLRPSLQRLITVTGDVEKSQASLSLAMDIAAGTGRDLDQVTMALARAHTGQFTALNRLGVGLDQATLKSKDMDKITGALSDKFAGQAAAAAETYAGRMARIQVAVGEAQEEIGVALLEAIESVTNAMGGPDGFIATIDHAGVRIADFIRGVTVVVTTIQDLTTGAQNAIGPLSLVGDGFEFIDRASPVGVLKDLAGRLADMGAESRAAAEEQRGMASATVATARAAGGAVGPMDDLTDATDDTGSAARTSAKSYVALFESIVNAARVARDFANTSGTVTSAIREGVEMGGIKDFWNTYSEGARGAARAAREAKQAIDEANDAAARRPSGGGGGGGGGPAPAPEPAPFVTPEQVAAFTPILTPQQFRATAAGRPPSGEARLFAEIRAFAEGGIINRPTIGLVGEAGPEAIIPLDQMGRMGGTTNITINVTAGMGTDGGEVGRQIVDALRQYQRRNGPVPIAVA